MSSSPQGACDGADSQRPAGERIQPVAHPAPASAPPPSVPAGGQGPFFWIAVAIIALLLCLVVLWLPSQINQRAVSESVVDNPGSGARVSAPEAQAAREPAAQDTEAVLASRQKAQRIADALQLRRAELEKLAVERWAGADYQQVMVNDDRASQYFKERDFEAAATYWQKSLAQANTLLGQVEAVLKSTVVKGYEALKALDSEAAVEAFDLALAIHPQNALATVGMQRARNLPEILRLMAAAENHERQDRLDQAMILYREVLQLDPQAPEAREAIQRLGKSMLDWEFRITLSTAQQALDAGDLDAARREFQNAGKLKEGDPAVAEGLAQVELALQQRRVNTLRQRAKTAEDAEQWGEAVKFYEQMTAIDNTLTSARAGLARSRDRLALDQSLQALVTAPERLYSETVLANAKTILADAQAVSGPRQRLQEQILKLQEAIAAAQQSVTVTLTSDKATSVMVYRVGRLGQFESTQLQLTPGDYVIVGRCDGFRDVRKTLSVRADQARLGPIEIRCTEKL